MFVDGVTGLALLLHTWASRQEGGSFKKRWAVLLSNGQIRFFADKLAMDEIAHIALDSQTVFFIFHSRQHSLVQQPQMEFQ
jgi:hypothetical protein